VGELFRLKGFLLIDYVIPVLGSIWLISELKKGHGRKVLLDPRLEWALVFVVLGEASLAIHASAMTSGEWLKASFYGVRFFFLFMLLPITESLTDQDAHRMRYALAAFLGGLGIAGFIQLEILPNFTAYEILGWDPHQGRLLSTWFDPNFVGGMFAFALPWYLEGIWQKTERKRALIGLLCALLISAILLTFSRSAYLAALAGIGLWTLHRSWKLSVLGLIAVSLMLTVSTRAQERVGDLVEGLSSVLENSYTLPDPSARLRFESWEEGWILFKNSPWIGQGMNRYSDAALHLGTMTDPKSHSATGADSSLLNVLALTGIFGLIAYVMMWAEALKQNSFFTFGFFGLLIHSIFVNSLFFPLLMAPVWIFAARNIKNRP